MKDSAADGKAGLEGNKRKMITFIGSAEEDVETIYQIVRKEIQKYHIK